MWSISARFSSARLFFDRCKYCYWRCTNSFMRKCEKILPCCKPKKEETQVRVISHNDPALEKEYPNNRITNSKYTAKNFIFLNIWGQFKRPLNCYFLVIAALQ
eukprot:gene14233-4185_t